MTLTNRTEALARQLAKQPARWLLLRHAPSPIDFHKLPAANDGGHWLELTTATFEKLTRWIGNDIHGEGYTCTAWLRKDGANLLDAPDAVSAFAVAKVLFVSAKGMPFGLGRPYQLAANAYLLTLWTARQHDLIDVDTWAHCFVAGWVSQSVSFRASVGLTRAETATMLEDACKANDFPWNQTYRQRGDLPCRVKLFRGIAADEVDLNWLGQSWTDDRAAALRYVEHRRGQMRKKGWLVEAYFDRSDIATVFEHADPQKVETSYTEWIITPSANPIGLSVSPVRSPTESWVHDIWSGTGVV